MLVSSVKSQNECIFRPYKLLARTQGKTIVYWTIVAWRELYMNKFL